MENLTRLSAVEIVTGIKSGKFNVEKLVRSYLDRIKERDPIIRAWQSLDPAYAIEQARRLDQKAQKGPLHGVPVGVKDVIDTSVLPTEMGSPIYSNHHSGRDADCVNISRQAGAVILGKTVTAEFAGTAPTSTCNPLNTEHTPGGSSSGSAAAVADNMVPVAFGTQTGGSVIRPASFCGVIGFKPGFNVYNFDGIKAAAPSFDTLGLIARSLDDIDLFHGLLSGKNSRIGQRPGNTPRVGICRTHLWDIAEKDTVNAFESTIAGLTNCGAVLSDCVLPHDAELLTEKRAVVNAYERAHGLEKEWREHRDKLSSQMQTVCRRGFDIDTAEYKDALQFIEEYRTRILGIFDDVDILLTPAVNSEAPRGLEYAGDPRFQEIWTMLHLPSISLPLQRGSNGLPVGIQFVGTRDGDCQLLMHVRWISDRLP